MAITTVDDIAAGLANSQSVDFIRILTAAKAAGSFQSGWMAAGNPGAGVASPVYTSGSGYTCSSATAGAMRYANGAIQNWLARLAAACSQPGTIILYDRLWSCSFTAPTTTTLLSITTPGSLPARITDNGVDVECWLETFGTVGGAASGTFTVNYLNANTGAAKSGVIGAGGTVLVSAPVIGQLQPVPIAAGDTGVRSLVSFQNSVSMVSGAYGLTLMKPLARIVCPGIGTGTTLDWAGTGLSKIPSDACIMAVFLAQVTTAATIIGTMDIIDK
jgi:hypothetical protein